MERKDITIPFLPNPKLVEGAKFQGEYDIPIIQNYKGRLPNDLVPFSQKSSVKNKSDTFIHFYIYDDRFNSVIKNPEKYIEEFKSYGGIISPDCSLYSDLPLCQQIMNTYLNRAIGYFYQKNGVNVIPNIRWGDSRSYSFCFDGLEKGGIYCISTYGCIKNLGLRKLFKEGLDVMLTTLNPTLVIVHSSIPDDIFKDYIGKYNFIRYKTFIEKRLEVGV